MPVRLVTVRFDSSCAICHVATVQLCDGSLRGRCSFAADTTAPAKQPKPTQVRHRASTTLEVNDIVMPGDTDRSLRRTGQQPDMIIQSLRAFSLNTRIAATALIVSPPISS